MSRVDITAMVADPEFRQLPRDQQVQAIRQSQAHNAQESGRQPPGAPPTRSGLLEALPVGGAILGGTFGTLTGPLAPLGAPLGAGLGAGIGEEAAQTIEMLQGKREKADPVGIFRQAGEQAAMEGAGKAVAPLVAPVGRAVGRVAKGAATKVVEAVMPRSAYEARLVQAYRANEPLWKRVTAGITGVPGGPRTTAQTLTERGIWGTESGLGIRAKRATQSLWDDLLQPALQRSQQKVHLPTFFDDIEQQIIKENPELARQADLLEGLQSLRESYKGVGDISMEELQKFKQGWAKFVPEKAYQGKSIAGVFNEVKDIAANHARETIYNTLGPDIRQAYLDYGNLQGVMEYGQRAMTGGKLRGGTGGFLSGLKDVAVTPIATAGSQVVYRTANGIQFYGPAGARTLRAVIPGLFEVGKPTNDPGVVRRPAPTAAPPATPTPTPELLQQAGPQGGQFLGQAAGQMASKAVTPPAQQELARLGITLPRPTTIRIGNVDMPPELVQKQHALRDGLVSQQIDLFMKHGPYRSAPPETQRRILQKLVNKMGRVAQWQLRKEQGQALRADLAAEKAPEAPDPAGP